MPRQSDFWFSDEELDRSYIQRELVWTLRSCIQSAADTADSAVRERALRDALSASEVIVKRVLRLDEAGIKIAAERIKLREALREMRDRLTEVLAEQAGLIERLQELEKLLRSPYSRGRFHRMQPDGLLTVFLNGRTVDTEALSSVLPGLLPGDSVRLTSDRLVVVRRMEDRAEEGVAVTVKALLDAERVVVQTHLDEERVLFLSASLRGEPLRSGDILLADGEYAVERLPKKEMSDLLLEEAPSIRYEDIGGLQSQINKIRDAIDLPYFYPELYKEFAIRPPKGILLSGPPGCGKTMIAKAVANDLARKVSEQKGVLVKGYFINVKGPELLTKWVGESERKIREIFLRAKEQASEETPVIIFFDEMDAMFRTRGTGVSSDVEDTIVPQLLAELDGVENIRNVIVIGASNRDDLIDPAILRPGRLDVKVRIDRPDAPGAVDILLKYLHATLPIARDYMSGTFYEKPNRVKTLLPKEWTELDRKLADTRTVLGMRRVDERSESRAMDMREAEAVIAQFRETDPMRAQELIDLLTKQPKEWAHEAWELVTPEDCVRYFAYKLVESLYIETPHPLEWVSTEGTLVRLDTRFAEITYQGGTKRILYYRDLMSGALLEDIVRRAKLYALKRSLTGGAEVKGLRLVDFWRGADDAFFENESLNTMHPDDWARIVGEKGERVVSAQPMRSGRRYDARSKEQRPTERVVNTGQYL